MARFFADNVFSTGVVSRTTTCRSAGAV